MKTAKIKPTFYLFRAPAGEAGFVRGATTAAGRFDLADTDDADWNAAIDEAAGEKISELGLTWLGNGDLIGECGLLLPEDYLEQIDAAAHQASYCNQDDEECGTEFSFHNGTV